MCESAPSCNEVLKSLTEAAPQCTHGEGDDDEDVVRDGFRIL